MNRAGCGGGRSCRINEDAGICGSVTVYNWLAVKGGSTVPPYLDAPSYVSQSWDTCNKGPKPLESRAVGFLDCTTVKSPDFDWISNLIAIATMPDAPYYVPSSFLLTTLLDLRQIIHSSPFSCRLVASTIADSFTAVSPTVEGASK